MELRNSLSLEDSPEVVKELLDKKYWLELVNTLAQLNKVIETSPLGIK